ncbi:hypothetical protein LUZ60_011652 [Juncus effusus]|nr:hypothetical protein LUZ60_011652 [Juncus effusus]
MGPDWSNLPADVVQFISEKITLKEQYAHLRLVCQQWRRACPPQSRHLIGQVPWLMLPHDPASSTLSFDDLSRSKRYDFNLPDIIHKICGHSHGWILLEKDNELSLINPITGEMKSNCLPSLRLNNYIIKVILTSSPSDEGCIVVAEFSSEWDLGFCRIGDNSWTTLKLEEGDHDSCEMTDFKYKNELVYAINNKGQITVYDLQNLSQSILIGEGEFDGVPLAVRRVSVNEFEVYKCTNGKGRYRWRRVRNIGNAVLVISNEQCEIVSLNNIQLNGWEKNHVYYDLFKCGDDGTYYDCMEMASIENGFVKDVPASLGVHHPDRSLHISWFTPSLG